MSNHNPPTNGFDKRKHAINRKGRPRTFDAVRHVRGNGYTTDCVKYNRATAQGWAVFRLTGDMLRDAPAQHIGQIIATIEARLHE